jgi:uncharacterized membrane protein
MIICVFNDEAQAYEGSSAVKQLHRDGSMTVYAGAIVARDADGVVQIKEAADEGPVGTAVGMLAGCLVGILGGPAGIVLGTATGGLIGSIRDLSVAGVDAEFLDVVSTRLEPGKTALVIEAAEHWTTPLDTRISALGGSVLRRSRTDIVDEQIERNIQASRAELAQLRAEAKQASDDTKAKVQTRVEEARGKLEGLRDRATAEIDRLQKELAAKAERIEGQIKNATAETKERFDQRKVELGADYQRRSDKLREAARLAGDALSA